ncbi:4-carboxymuconolactone decarboxylase [Selenomonas ruminantium]|uniref:4-carboxymuconolactone decarboxylase n=1 Tax=Selenomonas ruminantium TaxID=971 RepID=A0A1I3H0Y2_SELRU|nr:carboxymuconolactone decarboxylase family protein [Selenomonas ruminantium]SFI29276.1 4-carboxymuconolactone decarboxylase [Selenomonas ruminantium]
MKKRIIAAGLAAATAMSANFLTVEAAAMANNNKRIAVKVTQTAGRQQLGEFAPDFARYNDDILFGEVWSKNDILSLHDRSIVTVSALVASGMVDSSLKYHLQSAKKNGVTKAEMAEVITQLGFYAGWPKAWAAFNLAKEVYNEPAAKDTERKGSDTMDLEAIKETSMFPVGSENVNYAQYFDGKSYLHMISTEQVVIGNVTFEPGCRNHWHIHHADKGGGQMLLVTAGRGWYQEWGKPAQELKTGDVVHIPANVKHWHGAAKDSAFQHIAVEVPGENTSNEWCEPVAAQEYNKLP